MNIGARADASANNSGITSMVALARVDDGNVPGRTTANAARQSWRDGAFARASR
jgi:hypothetical protein